MRKPAEKENVQDKAEDMKEEAEQKGEDIKDRVEGRLVDGTYTGESDHDDHGNYGTIEVTVKDNKVTEVVYKEHVESGEVKGSDYPYQLALEAWPKLEKDLVDKQDPDKVDDVAGATHTSEKFRVAAERALKKAK